MNRRLLENSITEIKFPSAAEQEWNLLDLPKMGGDLNAFSRHPTESCQNTVALWLEEKDIYDPDFFGDSNWSEVTGRTVSSCSWGDDEFERESTNKVQVLLDAIDEVIYENNNSETLLDEEVLEECQEWAQKYPYLRLKGKSVAECFDSETVPCQTSSESSSQLFEENLGNHATDSGIAVSVGSSVSTYPGVGDDNYLFTNDCTEELIAQDGQYKECTDFSNISDKGNRCVDSSQAISKINPSIVNNLKESVVERLVNDLWPEVLSQLRETKGRSGTSKHEVLLPPITVASECRTPMSRPGTEERICNDSTDFPSLDGILTVSSKVLQKRREHKTGSELGIRSNLDLDTHRSHGTSEINTLAYKDNGFRTSHPVDGFGIQEHSKHFRLPHQKLDYDSQEEDYHSLPDIVRGIHIEPEAKDSVCKCRVNDNAHSSPRPMSFLPPIDDTESFSSQQQDLFIESPVPFQLNKFECHSLERNASRNCSRPNTSSTSKNQRHTLPARSPSIHETNRTDYQLGRITNRSNSRPNTSMTSRSIPDLVVKRKKSVVADSSSQYNGFRSKLTVPQSPSQKNTPSQYHGSNKYGPNVWSSEKPVTLFPLVTSLEPEHVSNNQKGRSLHNMKKGFLGSVFTNRSKR